MINPHRIHVLKQGTYSGGHVLYWMSRDQRVHDNWALLTAQQFALEKKSSFSIVFVLTDNYPGATWRHYVFMLKALQELEKECNKFLIPFYILKGAPETLIPSFVEENDTRLLITDFDLLRIKRQWKSKIADAVRIPFYEVDAHNIVPCWHVSSKQEFSAKTIRGKIQKLLPLFLEDFPKVKRQKNVYDGCRHVIQWDILFEQLRTDNSVPEVKDFVPGEKAAKKQMESFLKHIDQYAEGRNDPNQSALSGLSPYLHFGHIASQRIAMEIAKLGTSSATAAFLEELIVRKELSDNYCFYNPHYDSVSGFPAWAKKTLDDHRSDEREYLYSQIQLEQAQTHDDLWNAAQTEMRISGKMHGYMRMYWAKKILEWTESPEEALRIAIYLNDKYSLDGRDPNGYTGCAWSIGGVHDRAWSERPVFGKIRYMNFNGCTKKFNVDKYIRKYNKG